MKVLHTISSLGINSGGPSLSTTLLVEGLSKHIDVEILSFDISSNSDRLIIDKDYVNIIPPPKDLRFAYSSAYKAFLKKQTQFDVFHLQGVWQYPSFIGAKIARKKGVPYLITPRGMLYPQAIGTSRVKNLALKLFLKKDLDQAACIHATCEEEMRYLRKLGVSSPIAVIPNPIEIPPLCVVEKNDRSVLRFGYLGRLSPRKHIERILYAWEKLSKENKKCELLIMGKGDDDYEAFLKKEVNRLELKNVIFTGFVSGDEKDEKVRSLSCLVVPSNFENFGMIIAEALVNKVPVIASKGTPWEELDTHQCGWWINNDVDSIYEKMSLILTKSNEQINTMGESGYQLIKGKYSVSAIESQMLSLYSWVLNGKEKPDFVYLD